MKESLKKFGKVAGVFAWALFAIGASAAALNSAEVYYMVCGIANLGINGYCIYKTGKKIGM